jgi:hypothetical protein
VHSAKVGRGSRYQPSKGGNQYPGLRKVWFTFISGEPTGNGSGGHQVHANGQHHLNCRDIRDIEGGGVLIGHGCYPFTSLLRQ